MLWAVGSVGFATTVIPPTFDELVDRAEIIFEGRVTAIESRWVVKDENRAIKTLVTFEVLEALKGEIDATYTLEVLGGTVGDVTLTVEGAPIFAMGDRNLLFVTNNGTQFVPLVGIMHGSYRFKKDPSTNKDVVLKHDGELLREVSELGKEKAFDGGRLKRIMPQAAPMTAETFKEKIRTKTQGSKR